MNPTLILPFILHKGFAEVNNRPKIHHPAGTPSVHDHTFGSVKNGLLVLLKLLETFSIFN